MKNAKCQCSTKTSSRATSPEKSNDTSPTNAGSKSIPSSHLRCQCPKQSSQLNLKSAKTAGGVFKHPTAIKPNVPSKVAFSTIPTFVGPSGPSKPTSHIKPNDLAKPGCQCASLKADGKKASNTSAVRVLEAKKSEPLGCKCSKSLTVSSLQERPKSAPTQKSQDSLHRPVCHCDMFRGASTQKLGGNQIPPVQIDIHQKGNQKVKIDVAPIIPQDQGCLTFTIPLTVTLTKEDDPIEPNQVESVKSTKVLDEDDNDKPKINFLYSSCGLKGYYEQYMQQLADENYIIPSGAEDPLLFIEPAQKDLLYNKCKDQNYSEPYTAAGYCTSRENVAVQTELALGKNLLSVSLNSVDGNKCGSNPELPWELMTLSSIESYKITPVEKKPVLPEIPERPKEDPKPDKTTKKVEPPPKKKKKGGCCGYCGKEEDEPYMPTPAPPPPPVRHKISFVFDKACVQNEPYAKALLREFPLHETNSLPCTSKTELPWHNLLLPEEPKIRRLLNLTPEASVSSPCTCKRIQKELNFCKCSSQPTVPSVRNINSAFSGSSKTVHLLPTKTCSYMSTKFLLSPDENTSSKVLNGQRKTKLARSYEEKNNGEKKSASCVIKTKFSGHGINDENMRTKITMKNTGQKDKKSDWMLLSDDDNEVTCKYINSKMFSKNNLKPSTSRSAPAIPCEICKTPGLLNQDVTECSALKNSAYNYPDPVYPNKELDQLCEPCKMSGKSGSSSSITVAQDPVLLAFQACEAELRPVKLALNKVQQKLKNLNMPELDCIFNKKDNPTKDYLPLHPTRGNRLNKPKSTIRTTVKVNLPQMNHQPMMPPYPVSNPYGGYPSPIPPNYQHPYPIVPMSPNSAQYSYGTEPMPPNFGGRNNNYLNTPLQNSSYVQQDYGPSYSNRNKKTSPGHKIIKRKNSRKISRKGGGNRRKYSKHEQTCCLCSRYYNDDAQSSRSEAESYASSSPSEDNLCSCPSTQSRKPSRKNKQINKRGDSQVSFAESSSSQCPFLEAIKSILLVDSKKVTKRGHNLSYDTRLSTQNVENLRLHLRVRPSKCKKKK